jgi:CBS domain-containing protein
MKRLAWRTVLPALLAFSLFSGVVFLYLLPSLDRVVMDQKRLMIRELTESAWNVLARFEAEERAGRMPRAAAQSAAIEQTRNLHYGQESKDYFWIVDMEPRMIVHPYRPDLEGSDLTGFADPEGKLLFVEMVGVVEREGSGYVDYMWQWKDDPDRVVPKLSFVKGFEPWGWILGTGVYTEDVDDEINAIKSNLRTAALLILLAVSLLLYLLLRASFQAEAGRLSVVAALQVSEEKYRSLVESAGEAIMMAISGEGLYANARLLRLLGYERDEFAELEVDFLIRPTTEELWQGRRRHQAIGDGVEAPGRYEAELLRKDGSYLRVMLTLSRIVVQGRAGFMAVAAQFLRPRELDVHSASDLDDLEAASRRTRDLATMMMNHGADGVQVSGMLSAAADGVVLKAVEFIVAELGAPPVPFDIMLMGSLGRREVTLSADQDHAIIYADVAGDLNREEAAAVQDYFLRMGARLADLLYASGYPYCEGKIMASEAEFCRPLSAWCSAFDGWVTALEPGDLLQAKIFFDFRSALGEGRLVPALRTHLAGSLAANPRFFPMLAHSILQYEPPLGPFGALVVKELEGARKGLDIKGVLAQLVDVARLWVLQCGAPAVGTFERLEALESVERVSSQTIADTKESFRILLGIRLRHQAQRRARKLDVDNDIDPDALDDLQRKALKGAFGQLKALQASLRHEFGVGQ